MTDILTRLCLVGAAVLFAAWLGITGGRWLARQWAAIPRLLSWENFFLNRDTNSPVSAQLELMPSGDTLRRV
ncbi:MAG: hypothetical protein IJG84_05315 [Kiritimatiellae bacterium]|nr:hypothetical protein [Kiritimatiellia bacterium]